jgi:serine/threonine protein kinase
MSPEQAAGETLDGRSDLFALGVTMWEALALRPLLPRGDPASTLLALSKCAFGRPSAFQRDTPPELENIVMRALARNPADRYATGEAMARELRELVHTVSPGFGRSGLVDFLDWLRPDGSRRSLLGPPTLLTSAHRVREAPAEPRRRPRWLVWVGAPAVGLIAGAACFAVLDLAFPRNVAPAASYSPPVTVPSPTPTPTPTATPVPSPTPTPVQTPPPVPPPSPGNNQLIGGPEPAKPDGGL